MFYTQNRVTEFKLTVKEYKRCVFLPCVTTAKANNVPIVRAVTI